MSIAPKKSIVNKKNEMQQKSHKYDDHNKEIQNLKVLYDKLSKAKEKMDRMCEEVILNVEISTSENVVHIQNHLDKFSKFKAIFSKNHKSRLKQSYDNLTLEENEWSDLIDESSNIEYFLIKCAKIEENMNCFDLFRENINLKRFIILSHEYLRINKCFVDKIEEAGSKENKKSSDISNMNNADLVLIDESNEFYNQEEDLSQQRSKEISFKIPNKEIQNFDVENKNTFREININNSNELYSLNNIDQFNIDLNKKIRKDDPLKMKNDILERQIEENIKKTQEMMAGLSRIEETVRESNSNNSPSKDSNSISIKNKTKEINTNSNNVYCQLSSSNSENEFQGNDEEYESENLYQNQTKKKFLNNSKRRREKWSSSSQNGDRNENESENDEVIPAKKSFTYKFYSHSLIIKKYTNSRKSDSLCYESSEFTPYDLNFQPSENLRTLETLYNHCSGIIKQNLLKENGPLDIYIQNNLDKHLHVKTLYYSEFDMANKGNFNHYFFCSDVNLNKTELFTYIKVVLCRKGKLPIHNLIKSCENLFKKFIKRKDKVGNCVIKGILGLPFDKFQTYFTQKMKSFEAVQMIQIEVFLFKWEIFQDFNPDLDKTNLEKTEMKKYITNFETLNRMRIANRKIKLLMEDS